MKKVPTAVAIANSSKPVLSRGREEWLRHEMQKRQPANDGLQGETRRTAQNVSRALQQALITAAAPRRDRSGGFLQAGCMAGPVYFGFLLGRSGLFKAFRLHPHVSARSRPWTRCLVPHFDGAFLW